jgi:ABC-type multidrug transport system ATPase subunit
MHSQLVFGKNFHTIQMLTGDERITSGKAKIMGLDIETNLDAARKHYGYCPQEDGIDPLLNAYEQLELYGRLRGLTKDEVENVRLAVALWNQFVSSLVKMKLKSCVYTCFQTAKQLISQLGLRRYADKRCGTYSGGNKRKVSTAIALIGNPDLVFLVRNSIYLRSFPMLEFQPSLGH